MSDTFKVLDAVKDIKTQTFPIQSSLYTITGQTQATSYDTKIYTVGASSLGYIYKPDSLSTTTAGISPSGAINSIAKRDFNRYSAQFLNSSLNIYTLPASNISNVNVSQARVMDVSQPTKDSGIWPDTVTAVFTYNGATLSAIDSSSDSFGPNKESLSYGKLTEVGNPTHVVGSIFYDDGTIILHGGTGVVGSAFTSTATTDFAFRGSITGGLTASTSASTIVVESLSFRTYEYLTRNVIFCRAFADEFNYTSNPSAQMVPFLQTESNATVYITTIGLYNDKDELLAVAKVAPAYRKTQFREITFAVTISV